MHRGGSYYVSTIEVFVFFVNVFFIHVFSVCFSLQNWYVMTFAFILFHEQLA